MKIVIIGASAAGISAAKTIKASEPVTEVVIISKEDSVHSRCMLHKFLGHERDAKGISFIAEDFFEKNGITWLSNTTVIGLDAQKKTVKTHDNRDINYDKLLIATGASYFIPPIPGLRESKNVYGFRDLKDAQLLDSECNTARNAVVIGAGLVGMDAAVALLARGLKVTVIEMTQSVMSLQLDQKSAEAYQQLFEKNGTEFVLADKVVSVDVDEVGRGKTIHLASGKAIPADVIVIAAGVRPAFNFTEGSGITTDHAILVGDDLKTNIDDIYAAGDVTGIAGIWPNAMKQGRIAAINMLGEKLLYEDRYALKNTVNFFGLTTLSLGNINPEVEENCDIFIREDRNNYQKIVMKKGVVQGVIIQGNIGGTGFWQYLIKNKIDVSSKNKDVFDLSYADFYGLDQSTGEYNYAV
ncbi:MULTISPECIES: NAD(P)/FAD-dependent oxidoreductase [unclassified Acetobacterium]|jgi:NAD(P)H-nitrite reductase large subunit|uniref:NAD(P)/FAD-dependent oxidoreductase n=1 Tax=unclassified Acetobacterium TaxID=2638182 RepID=UPI000DBEC575|nr:MULTISPECIES: FAD-dependent oxidoreductase [unclassified Acetobacterium]AWW25738.1 NAD(P)/FAD-dependent oxidoreductase [Acetobacterium sp. KB-1]MDZ5724698.1 FAD-dependent oxidoreductase [Acetobacterium sp. K1/6]